MALSLAAAGWLTGQEAAPTPTPTATKEQADDATGFKEFTARVGGYMTLRKNVEKKLPAMKNKEQLPEMITAHQQALARKIREARPHARSGNIFTPAAREAFRHAIRSAFQEAHTSTAPDAVAETAFPPTLLQKLPTLPEELAYRIVGRDLVLVDSKANLVLDLLHEALP
jgi:hypothetical protein